MKGKNLRPHSISQKNKNSQERYTQKAQGQAKAEAEDKKVRYAVVAGADATEPKQPHGQRLYRRMPHM